MIEDLLDDVLEKIKWGQLIDQQVRKTCAEHTRMVLNANQRINLTRITDPYEIVIKHIIDSLWLLPVLDQWNTDPPEVYLDVGSGGGWPFVPIASVFFNTESWCCEKTLKKANFLEEVCQNLLPQTKVYKRQIQELRHKKFDLVTARAVGTLEKIFQNTHHLINKGGILAFYKGPSVEEELLSFELLIKKFNFKLLPFVEVELPDQATRVFVGVEKID